MARDSVRNLDWDTPHLQVSFTWCPLSAKISLTSWNPSFHFLSLILFLCFIKKTCSLRYEKDFINDILLIWVFLPSLPIIKDTKSFVNHELKVKVCLSEKKEKIPFLFPSQLHLSERFMAWQPCKLMGSSYSHSRPSTKCAIMSLQMLPQLRTWRINFEDITEQSTSMIFIFLVFNRWIFYHPY